MAQRRRSGRPTFANVAERQRAVVRRLAAFALEHGAIVRELAQYVDAGERAVRHDLEGLAEKGLHDPKPCVSEEIRLLFERAESEDDYLCVEERLWAEHAAGRLSLAEARHLTAGCRQIRRLAHERTGRLSDLRPRAQLRQAQREPGELIAESCERLCRERDDEAALPSDGTTYEESESR